jgi:hypothetical protein
VRIEGQLKKCVLCDATLDVPDRAEPKSHIEGRSGEPNVRVLTVKGREIHRCEVRTS